MGDRVGVDGGAVGRARQLMRDRVGVDGGAVGVRIAGRGGQGVMLAGLLLAQAAMDDGLHVVQTQSYGPEARLGAAKSDVILSPDQIAYPEVIFPDVFLCLSRDALAAYSATVPPRALSIIDERAANGLAMPDAILLALTDTARDCGAPFATNIVGLGVLVSVSGIASERSLRGALAARVSPESLDANLRAFGVGLALGRASRTARRGSDRVGARRPSTA